jgi:hypothetical protein
VRDTTVVNFLTATIPNPMAGLLGTTSLTGTTAPGKSCCPSQFSTVNSDATTAERATTA